MAKKSEKPTFEPYEGSPDTTVGYTKADGSQATIAAGGDGIFHPESQEEVDVLRGFDFKAMKASAAADEKAAKTADAPAPDAKE